jgi:hypothetical protein
VKFRVEHIRTELMGKRVCLQLPVNKAVFQCLSIQDITERICELSV